MSFAGVECGVFYEPFLFLSFRISIFAHSKFNIIIIIVPMIQINSNSDLFFRSDPDFGFWTSKC